MSSINTHNTQLREIETKDEFLTRWNNRLLAPSWQTSTIFLFLMPSLMTPLGSDSALFVLLSFLWVFMIGKTIWSAKQWKKFKAQYQTIYGKNTFAINGRKRALIKHFGFSFSDLLKFRVNVLRYGLSSAVELATGNPYSILNQAPHINALPNPPENITPHNLPVLPFIPPSPATPNPVEYLPTSNYKPDMRDPRLDYLNSVDPRNN